MKGKGGIILYMVAVTMLWILSPLFLLFAIIIRITSLSKYFRDVALSIDQLGNTMGGPIMDLVLLKKGSSHKFGNPDQTISYVLGANYKTKTLTLTGIIISEILNRLDKNHVEKAVENEE